jgi:Uma2 family endonuclease
LRDFFKLETSDREEKFLTSDVTWQAYESLLTSLGDRSSYRVAYLSGILEIMSPSRSHEKENIGRLLEAYLEENRIRFWGLGSTTFRQKDQKDIPDLAIEVIYTSGGVDTLEIYQRLGVGEVWFWQDRQLKIYCLQDNNYQQTIQSELLPDLDLALLAQYVFISDPLEAVVEWRKQVRVN